MSTGRRRTVAMLWGIVPVLAVLWQASGWGVTPLFQPPMEDLMVYRRAAQAWVGGGDPYRLENSYPFIYPPFAVLPSVLLVVPTWLAKLFWTIGNVAAMYALVHRLGVRGIRAMLLVTGVFVVLEPMVNTAALGQLGTWLMVMCAVDLLDASADGTPGRVTRAGWLPVGVWVGLATGLKLTPGVFIVLFLLLRRWPEAIMASITFALTMVIGTLAMPNAALGYWTRLARGDSGANPDAFGWIHNQSMLSGWQRFIGVNYNAGGLLLCALLVALGLASAYRCMRRDQPWLAVGLLGLASSLANPIAWLHHLTWVLPLAVGAWRAGVPVGVRVVAVCAALWWQVRPFQNLPGAPWAEAEMHQYSVAQKFLAWGGALACLLAVAATAAWPWHREVESAAEAPLAQPVRAGDS